MNDVRVLVVEDQPRILEVQLRLLASTPGIEVLGSARSGEEALNQCEALQPEVILCDLGLPDFSGVEVTRRVKKRWPRIEILMFTIFEEEEQVLAAIRAGAAGYLLKGASAGKIGEALREIRGGGTVIQPSLARMLLKHFHAPEQPTRIAEPGIRALSPREQEILQLIAKGISNVEAAAMLGLSRATVRTHLEHVYEKLEVNSRVEAVTEGLRLGIIEV